jgi:organic hydroperoxide reductase OsmC/OhrA
MSEEKTHHVTVRLSHGYESIAEFTDLPQASAIRFDEPPPLGRGSAPNAVAVLGAAVGNCLAASFAFCLRKARIEPQEICANVTTHVIRNERGRFRIGGIDVEITPQLSDSAGTRAERCEALFEEFCTVTASVRHGIPVRVTLHPEGVAGTQPAAGLASPVDELC